MPILLGLVVLNFILNHNGHTGPITWLFNEIYRWWASVLGITVA
jgi:hypothetical protein